MPLSNVLNHKAAKPDLSSVLARQPAGLNDTVKGTFKYIRSPDSSIGLLGFEFMQLGVLYQVRYKDDLGNDKYTFEVVAPTAHPYIHRNDKLGIAEKAHALMMVMELMDENTRSQNIGHLNKLEQACFDPASGTFRRGLICVMPYAQTAKIISHYDLRFPDDADFAREPEMRVVAMEWVTGLRYKLIDNSEVISKYIMTGSTSRDIGRMNMGRDEARKSLEYAKNFAQVADLALNAVALKTNLWVKLESNIQYLGEEPIPVCAP